jgi:hypothetical protein
MVKKEKMSAATTLVQGRRSSIVSYDNGNVMRIYHDTGTQTPLPFTVDKLGATRVFGNRSLQSLSTRYRGGTQSATVPFYIRNTLTVLMDEQRIESIALRLSVKESTAWCYVCKLVEVYPSVSTLAARLIYQPLLTAMTEVDMTGSLKEVMERLNSGPLRGSVEWRSVDNRYAHLRLARLCFMKD